MSKRTLQIIGVDLKKLNGVEEAKLDLLASNNGIKLMKALMEYNEDDDVNDAFDQTENFLDKQGEYDFERLADLHEVVKKLGLKKLFERIEEVKTHSGLDNLVKEHLLQDESQQLETIGNRESQIVGEAENSSLEFDS